MWTTAKLLREFRAATEDMAATVEAKNADYAGDGDPFGNFRLIEETTRLLGVPVITAEEGIVVRLMDKVSRIVVLTQGGDPKVSDETHWDTCRDAAAYFLLLGLLRRARTEPDETTVTVAPVDPVAQAPTPWDLLRAAIAQATSRNQGAPEA